MSRSASSRRGSLTLCFPRGMPVMPTSATFIARYSICPAMHVMIAESMVIPTRVFLAVAAAIVCLTGCESPTDLHRGPTTTTGIPSNFYLQHWAADAETQTLSVESWGIWGVTYTLERAV